MKLLLHTCCAPCSLQCVSALAEENLRPQLFWYNPNIHPYTEYRSRRDSLTLFAEKSGLPLTKIDEYGLRPFLRGAFPLEGDSARKGGAASGRCVFCYRLRLERTARYAAENGFDAFSTTLLISPYQDHDQICLIGRGLAARYGLEFFYRDFRPRFRRGQNEAREAGYYMQKYCGCIYSEEERYAKK